MDVRKLSVDQDILYKYITKANEGDILWEINFIHVSFCSLYKK